ncbi:GNAT family N-acetyltransferase [Clostridium sp. AL.422]|uniref:GNAT family N-acetyltransferase n=1 Tax=Clostridium TaxID=1485 RepID=UPI00293DDA79|nr:MULTISPECIES: GNAT family N-acetyltransferase [unclassified Clostridium]MDV4151337.1 GNAT family N-acetyltransferase [Clostridium sp. AL.422]
MINNLTIIRPTKDDLKSTYSVFEESITDAFEKEGLGHLKEDILSEIEYKKYLINCSVDSLDPDTYFFIAKIDDNVIGTISFGPCGNDIKKCTNNELDAIGELGSLYVLPDYQGKGVGSALIHTMIEYIHKLGIEEFCLDSGYRRAQKRWLRKFGEPYKIVKNYWGENNDHMIWGCKVKNHIR